MLKGGSQYMMQFDLNLILYHFPRNHLREKLYRGCKDLWVALQFLSIAQVAGVTKSGNDVFVFVHSRVYGCTPNRGLILGEGFLDMVNAFRRGDDTAYMDLLRRAFGEESLIA